MSMDFETSDEGAPAVDSEPETYPFGEYPPAYWDHMLRHSPPSRPGERPVTYRDAFDAASFPIVVHQDGRSVYSNPAADRLLRRLGSDGDDVAQAHEVVPFVPPHELARRLQATDPSNWNALRAASAPASATASATDGRRPHHLASVVRTTWHDRPALCIALRPARRPAETKPDGAAAAATAALSGLTRRERQVVDLIATGYSTLNAATVLGVSESTIRYFVKVIFRKTGVHSRVDLARLLSDPAGRV
jgi:DNA-binding NarL/FixJ family response regulator